jgi:hypothetical protein
MGRGTVHFSWSNKKKEIENWIMWAGAAVPTYVNASKNHYRYLII